VRTAVIGAILLVLGAIAAAATGMPVSDLGTLAGRVVPILVFVVAITVVAELADAAGVFRRLAAGAARLGRGRTLVLFLLVALLAAASSALLSLDTAAVLLTPVVVLLARQAGLPPLPFALTTVWLANTASLLLPVSNLTNLLATDLLGLTPLEFAARMVLPELVAVAIPVLVVFLVFRRTLLTRYSATPAAPAPDRVLFVASAVVVAVLVPFLVSGLPVAIPATVAALVLAAFFLVRRRAALTLRLIPWQLVVFAAGLFLVVEVAHDLGLSLVLGAVAGTGEDPLALLRLSGSAAVGANLLDNLPAYLAFEPVADSPLRLLALLIGVNAGPLITPWASLATLLWHSRLVSLGVELSWTRYALLGLSVAPLVVVGAVLALVVVPF